jgi:hypothetical protein
LLIAHDLYCEFGYDYRYQMSIQHISSLNTYSIIHKPNTLHLP